MDYPRVPGVRVPGTVPTGGPKMCVDLSGGVRTALHCIERINSITTVVIPAGTNTRVGIPRNWYPG
eukprot:942211-Rhodomonas_salina.1